MITVIGNVNLDLVMGPCAPWPQTGTEVILEHSEWRAGGSAGNCALALAALGAEFRLIANRGNDAFGDELAAPFGAWARSWSITNAATALSVGMTHPDGERTFFTSLGHLARFSLADVLAQLPTQSDAHGIALVCGSFVTPQLTARYPELFAELKARGFRVALDTGWPTQGWLATVRDTARTWLGSADFLLVNDIEARALSQAGPTAGIAAVADGLNEFLPRTAVTVVKQGAKGASAFRDGRHWHVDAPTVIVRDTIGAGDCFNAGFLNRLVTDADIAAAVQSGVTIASLAISTSPRRYRSG